MAENIPNIPTGAVPPKKETGKVQPKKETVRINLPPKPSAAPTIKLPTLPPGGPTGPGAAVPAPALSTAAAAPAHPPSAPKTGASAAPVATSGPRPAPPSSVVRSAPAPVPAAASLSPVDTILAIVAAVAGLIAAGSVVYVMTL